jgi:Sap, sulfolipid-1-addressing protein
VAAGIGTILTYAVGVAISPMSIIAVILMLFSARARVNGLMLVGGWLVALTVLFALAYGLADAADAATDTTASETVSWGKVGVGVVLLLLAARQWRSRPAPGDAPVMPKWMAGIDSFSPGKAFALGLIAVAAPKNLLLTLSAGTALAQVRGLDERGRHVPDRLPRRLQRDDRGPGPLPPSRRRQGEVDARRAKGLAYRAHRRRDDGAPPRDRRQADRRRPAGTRRLRRLIAFT